MTKHQLLTILFVLNFASVYCQWMNGGNSWITEQTFGTNSNHDIPFITNTIEQMRLTIGGDLGIGLTTPVGRLHLERTGASNVDQYWSNGTTGSSAADGFNIRLTTTGQIQYRLFENQDMSWWTNTNERMRLTTRSINNVNYARFSINAVNNFITNPRSILHLGYNYLNSPAMGAWRHWMNIGTFCDQGSDFVYFGLKREASDTVGFPIFRSIQN